jgi:hypothetical protein
VDRDDEVKCRYLGGCDEKSLPPLEKRPAPPTPKFAREVALSILDGARGSYRSSNHFSKQMADRGFDVFEFEYVIRNGSPVGNGEYSEEHKDHKFTFRGIIDGTEFDAVFSLSAEHDFIKSPLMILITGCWKTSSGRRTRTF